MSYLKGLENKVNGLDNSFTKELSINELKANENNFFGMREIDELAESIKENGLINNLVVREKDDSSYEIISGERRYRALLKLGYDKVPCSVKKDISDLDAEIMLIQANVESRELTASEKMEGISRLKSIYEKKKSLGEKVPGKIRDLIGRDIGLSGVQVGRYAKIDKDLIPELKEKLDKEEITLTQAHTLSSLNEDEQETIHEVIKDLDPKESKEEINIFIEGIKQNVESDYDEEIIMETYTDNEEEADNINKSDSILVKSFNFNNYVAKNDNSKDNRIDEINELLKQDPKPRLIINSSFIEGVFYTEELRVSAKTVDSDKICVFVGRDDSGEFKSTCSIQFDCFEKVTAVPVDGKIVEIERGYRVNENCYLWFLMGEEDR